MLVECLDCISFSFSSLLLCSPSPLLFCSLSLCFVSASPSLFLYSSTLSLPSSHSFLVSLFSLLRCLDLISALLFCYTLSPSPFSASDSRSPSIMSSSVPQSSLTFTSNLCILVSPPYHVTIERNMK